MKWSTDTPIAVGADHIGIDVEIETDGELLALIGGLKKASGDAHKTGLPHHHELSGDGIRLSFIMTMKAERQVSDARPQASGTETCLPAGRRPAGDGPTPGTLKPEPACRQAGPEA